MSMFGTGLRSIKVHSSSYIPTSLGSTTLGFWGDYSDTSTMLATIGGSPTTNGSGFAQLSDKSGNNRHATITSGTLPTRNDGSLNGRTTGLYTGSEAQLITNAAIPVGGTKSIELWCVIKRTSGTPFMIEPMPSGTSAVGGASILLYSSDLTYGYIEDTTSNQSAFNGSTTTAVGATSCHRWSPTLNSVATTTLMNVDGNTETTGLFFGPTSNTGTFSNLAYGFGGVPAEGASFSFHGNFAEVLIMTRTLTSTEATNLTNYLRAKWGFP